nr:glycosyltransferase family 2 protein [uncultured Aminipila sp.]
MSYKNDILLSISLIVKNEEENLAKCLDSLEHLMQTIPCQLIITDTGSTDGTAELAKKYTKDVYFFQWCNDFAAARNYGLKKAKGKWFMYMDADEWFDDTNEIEQFFLSGEYKKYKNATYLVRNYMTLKNNKHYHDSPVTRMYRMDKDLKFKGRIHEFISVSEPIKAFSTFAHHFSYADDNDREFLDKKYKRNLVLLEEEVKEDPDDARTVYHLVSQYMKMGKDNEWHNVVNEWYDKLKDNSNHLYLPFFVKHKSVIHFTNEPKKSIEILNHYIETRNFEKLWDLDLYSILAELYMKEKEYDNAIKICDDFLDLYKRYENGQVEKDLSYFVTVSERTNENGRAVAYEIKARCLMKKKQMDEAESTLSNIMMTELPTNRLVIVARLYINLLIENNHIDSIAKLYKQFMDDGDEKRVQIIFAVIEENLAGQYKVSKSLSEVFAKEAEFKDIKNDTYLLLQKLRYGLIHNEEGLYEIVQDFINIQSKDKFSSIYSEFLLSWFTGVTEAKILLTYFDVDDIKKYVARNFEMCDYLPTLLINWITRKQNTKCGIIESYFVVCMLEGVLLKTKDLKNTETNILFEAYVTIGHDYIYGLYNHGNFTDEKLPVLPRAVRFIYFADLAQKALKAGDRALYVKHLKCGIKHYPLMFKFVEKLVDEIVQVEENQNQAKLVNQNEFERQAVLIKEKIIYIAEQGMRDEAIELLDTYTKINPKDEKGINELKSQLKINN